MRALVLSGGGSRGAYEIGAWQALSELGVRLDGVYGTSIGALNAALVAQGDLDDALELWRNIRVSQIMTVRDEEAAAMCRLLARTEGMLVGLSSGAAAHAAFRLARQAQFQGQRIVTVFPDSGERYLSTGIFNPDAT